MAGKVKVIDGKVLRVVDDVDASEKIINVVLNKGFFNKKIVGTRFYSKADKILEHDFVSPIIHSGEYTTSMAYDVTEDALNLAIDMVKEGIYSFDLLPHNFTYHNGEWLLYDFGAFETFPKNAKTLLRSTFKISFSAFELLKKLTRSDLKHYFLNRIKTSYLFKMLPLLDFIRLNLKLRCCMILYSLKMYEQAYILLQKYFEDYKKQYKKEMYSLKNTYDPEVFNAVDEILLDLDNSNCFVFGEAGANWAYKSTSKISKFVYLDDYELCDKFYNLIRNNNRKDISTAVIYPYMIEDEIADGMQYKGIYDYFAQERFSSDVVIVFENLFQDARFCQNISQFAKKYLLVKFEKENKNFADEFNKYFEKSETIEKNGLSFVLFSEPKKPVEVKNRREYINNNRHAEENIHSQKILEILNNRQ